MLRFVLPGAQNRRDVLDFYAEFAAEGTACIGSAVAGDFDVWLANMQDRLAGRTLPAGFVQESFYLCYEGDTLVGVLNFKYTLTDFLLNYGGHIGYAVRPSCQGRGLATQMMRQCLDIARGLGFERLLLVCDDDNYASERVIQKCGGVLEDIRFDPDEQVNVKRYWITV